MKTPRPRKKMRVVAYLGTERMTPKQSRQVLNGLARRHDVVAVVAPKRNPIRGVAKRLGVPVVGLPPELKLKKPKIERHLEDPRFRERLDRWNRKLKSFGPEIGVSFYSDWIPPQVYTRLPRGFINYHPSDLTDAKNGFRGVMPEIASIMLGHKSFRGTVHKVAEGFDTGGILVTTPKMGINSKTTARTFYPMAVSAGVKALNGALDRIAAGKAVFKPQTGGTRVASKRFVRELSQISLRSSTAERVQRASNALNAEPEGIMADSFTPKGTKLFPTVRFEGVGLRLKDAKIYKGRVMRGRPGEIVGFSRGRPIVRTARGSVVLDFVNPGKLRDKMAEGRHFS